MKRGDKLIYTVTSLCDKDVIKLNNGMKIGTVGDVEFDSVSGRITSIVIFGKGGVFGFASKKEDIKIKWEDIEVIGDDTILVRCSNLDISTHESHHN